MPATLAISGTAFTSRTPLRWPAVQLVRLAEKG